MLRISKTVRKGAPTGASFLRFFKQSLAATHGKDYDLSLVFIGNTLSRRLNRTHRRIDKPTDILSFPLDKKFGEMFINIPYSKKKCRQFDRSFDNFIKFIFIHGLIHLKGMTHGSRMESEEKKLRNKFNV